MSTTSLPNIAIVGGGPSGLVALLTLLNRGVSATLYEREASSNARRHLGGMLDLTWDEGQRALRENGLADAFKKNSRLEGQENRICGKAGVILARRTEDDVPDETKARPEIDRRVLREILLAAIPEGAIKWDHALVSVRPLDDGSGTGKHELTFANGLVVVADYLIGADGAHSRIRPLLSPATPIYHDVNGAEISVAPAVAALPANADIRAAVGLGSCYCAEEHKLFSCQRNGDGRIRVYVWFRAPREWTLPREPEQARRVLHAMYEGWAPWMHKIIDVCDEDAIYPRPLFYLPVGHRWEHKPGVTIIGDAAHLMSPFAGMGANVAMYDGLQVGLALADAVSKGQGVEEREAALAVLEEKLCEHAKVFAEMSYDNVNAAFAGDAPRSFVEAMKAMGASQPLSQST